MRKRPSHVAGFALVVCAILFCRPPAGDAAVIAPEAWTAYKTAFLDTGGRIVDTGNGNISHSEGQGYGMLLATLADDRPVFELIWSFTRTEFLVRDDGLSAWKWDPNQRPHITDINNATDGDILIAYALARAGRQWNRPDYDRSAAQISAKIIEKTVIRHDGRLLLLPAAQGFSADERDDGPVINPSYLVFEAFPLLDQVFPSPQWAELGRDGAALMRGIAFSGRQLPAEWVSMRTRPIPANGFAAEFGYNALRIPLYLARGPAADPALLRRLRDGMRGPGGNLDLVDLATGAVKQTLPDPGYRAIAETLSCVVDGTPVSPDIKIFTPTLYYPSTLHLLALSFLHETHRECL